LEVEEPEARLVFVFISDPRVVLVFFSFFFGFGFGIWRKKGDGFAVTGPFEAADIAFTFGERLRFTAGHREQIDLLVGVAIGKEREGLAIGRPLGRRLGFCGVGKLAESARGGIEEPDVSGALVALGGFVDDEGGVCAVRGELDRGQVMEREEGFGSYRVLRRGRRGLLRGRR
jgi:hypothetical protein